MVRRSDDESAAHDGPGPDDGSTAETGTFAADEGDPTC